LTVTIVSAAFYGTDVTSKLRRLFGCYECGENVIIFQLTRSELIESTQTVQTSVEDCVLFLDVLIEQIAIVKTFIKTSS